MKCTSYGADAVLLQFAETVGDEAFDCGRTIATELERCPPHGLKDFVFGFTTVLLEFDSRLDLNPMEAVSQWTSQLEGAVRIPVPLPTPFKIPVKYDGPDLQRVAELSNLSVETVCQLHAARIYKVYMLGFSPGFPYLGDLDPRLHTPRLSSPRVRVPPGSVAIGGQHTGIYTIESPGGWNIIGSTSTRIFDLSREGAERPEEVFLLRPGDRVQFVPVGTAGST